jgi:type III secretion protein J
VRAEGQAPSLFSQSARRRQAPALLALPLWMAFLTACGSPVELVHGLTEFEANQVLVVMNRQGIPAKKAVEEGRIVTWKVVVNDSDADRGLALLVLNKLPKQRSQGLAEVYPAGGGGLIPTKSEEKARFLMALQGEIERKLTVVPGVLQAHVSIVQPDKDIIRDLDKEPPPSTASVAIVYAPLKDGTPPFTEKQMKSLVATSVEDLKPDNVEVLMRPNEALSIQTLEDGDASAVSATGETVLGIQVASKKAGTRAKGMLGLFAGLAVIGLILGVLGIVRSLSLRSKLSKSEAEVASMKKARRELAPS